MSIDINSLSYEDLLELHHIISERIRYLEAKKKPKQFSRFNQGDTVSFSHPSKGIQTGTLLVFNEKTATIITRSGQKWDVSPHLLRKIISKKNLKKSF